MISAIVLAAGKSLRMGQPKLLLTLEGKTLVRRVIENALAAKVGEVVVVVGHEAERVRAELASYAVRVVDNPLYAQGQSTSVIAGVRNLDPAAAAVVILMADQPFVAASVIDALIDRFSVGDCPIVAPEYNGQLGAPVLFDRSLFPALLQVTGDKGGRDIVRAQRDRVAMVKADPAAARDIDTWEEYQELTRETPIPPKETDGV